ncbi:MAG: hypothetical protein ABL957_07805 [Parvularculaceae bacterium]
MSVKSAAAAAFACVASMALAAEAEAALVISFNYNGAATVGGVTSNLSGTTSVNNAARYFGPPDSDYGNAIRDRASLINFADDSPFVFAAGGATQGTASAEGKLTVTVDITNDTGVAQEYLWQGLIYSGGVGFAMPQLFNGAGCTQNAIESCDAFTNTPFTVGSAEFASLTFAAAIAGVDLFSGAMGVSDTGASSTFNGIALNGFGTAANNANFLEWDETTFMRSLGVFAAGETKTLTFEIVASMTTLRGFCTSQTDPDCLLAMAGFGDPPGGDSGGVSQNSGGSARSVSFLLIAPASEVVPVPGAVWLFGSALALFGAHRRLRRSA